MKSGQYDILVIDDEQVILDAVRKICSFENFSVDTAPDVKIAVTKLDKNNYRLIICDIMLPDTDGFEFMNELNNLKILTPVIMATGYSTVENAVKSLYKGAIDFIPKPFTTDELLNSVTRGFRYSEIQKKFETAENESNNSTIIYVSCPARYYRLGYSTWVLIEHDGSVLTGVTDMFLKIIETVEEITFASVDEEIVQGISFCQITSKDGQIHELFSPISGRIIERNEALVQNISLIEKDPFFEGWIYRVIPNLGHWEQ